MDRLEWLRLTSLAAVALAIVGAILTPTVGVPILIAVTFLVSGLTIRTWMWARDAEREARLAQARAEMAEDEARHQQEIVDTFADGLDLALFLCDSSGSVLFANERATAIFRYPDPGGRSILAVTLSSEVERLALSALADDQTVQQEVIFHYPGERTGIVRAWPDRTNLARVFLSILDVTELRRLERVRRDFVANVSHELRTPITMIRAMAETLEDDKGADPELSERYLGRIISEVDRLTHVIADLLTLSTAESGTVERRKCDLVEIAKTVLGQFQEQFDAKGVDLRAELPDRTLILANPPQITQVLMNLVENALNYTQDGHVLVSLVETPGLATAYVEDTGIGIASEHVSRIFERFYRVDSARSKAPGTGLGLSIVKHIVESHGGSVEVESDLNRGSKFTIRLPLA